MKKYLLLLLIFILTMILGCQTPNDANIYYKFIDSSNTEIMLKEKPKNVAVLFSSFVEIYNLAGGKTNITVKESVERGLVGENVILVDDGAGKTINNEILIASNPDFVIGSLDITEQAKTCKQLNQLGIPSALFRVESFEDYLCVLNILTDITGAKDNYEKYGVQIENNIHNIKDSINKHCDIKILFIRSGSSMSSCKAKNKESNFVCKMLDELGAYNIADAAPILLDGLSVEEILLNEPDFIFISIMGNEEAGKRFIEDLFSNDVYSSLKAIKNNHYYFLEKDLFQYKPNNRWDSAYQFLVDVLYEKK